MQNPFPGMNPYLEQPELWHQVHNRLIVAIADDLTPQIAPKYRVSIEERVYTSVDDIFLVGIAVLKSGCGIEKLQLETTQKLEMALATYSIVAWRLLWLTYLARCSPSVDCEKVLETHDWQVLYPHTSLTTLAEVVDWIARLVGFLGRKGDSFPGVKILWRGLRGCLKSGSSRIINSRTLKMIRLSVGLTKLLNQQH
jgi:Protein of unknown function (DUF4058)/Transposase Tn5 dimerisation domain